MGIVHIALFDPIPCAAVCSNIIGNNFKYYWVTTIRIGSRVSTVSNDTVLLCLIVVTQ